MIEPNLMNEYREVYDFCHKFFECYYTRRDPELVVPMVSPNAICLGLSPNEVAPNREVFEKFLRHQVETVPAPIRYIISHYVQTPTAPGHWVVLAKLKMLISADSGAKMRYDVRLTAAIRKDEKRWWFDLVHTSEIVRRDPASLMLFEKSESEIHRELGEVISTLAPGGLVSFSITEGYPVLIANKQFLTMLGYSSYEEYIRAVNGLFINSIHPEDRENCQHDIQLADPLGSQCEWEYRLRRKNGTYLWVHDISRKLVSEKGQETVLSTLIDISRQRREREMLQLENELDSLTGIYNRKTACRIIEKTAVNAETWVFCIADLDNFKNVNDIYGHLQGDRVLSYTAFLMNKDIRKNGIVFRMGGDEFGLYLPGCADISQLLATLQEIIDQYAMILEERCPLAHSSLSIGGVYGRGRLPLQDMYRLADQNLYRVKETQKGQVLLTETSLL